MGKSKDTFEMASNEIIHPFCKDFENKQCAG